MRKCSVIPYEGTENFVFVVSDESGDAALPLIERLNNAGFRLWYDEGTDFGGDAAETSAERLNDARVCLAVITDSAMKSALFKKTLYYAVLKNKPIIPVVAEPVNFPPGIQLLLSDCRFLYEYRYPSADALFEDLSAPEVMAVCKKDDERERLAREREEQERLAREREDQERLAREQAEQERLAREREEQERLAREREEQERLAREQAEQERLAREQAEQERLAREQAEQLLEHSESFLHIYIPRSQGTVPVSPDGAAASGQASADMPVYQLVRARNGETVEIQPGSFVLGRSDTRANYIITDNKSIGRVHAIMMAKPEECTICDNYSMNKTYINGQELTPNHPYVLHDGDVVRLADEDFMFREIR